MLKTGRIMILTILAVMIAMSALAADVDVTDAAVSKLAWGNRTVSFTAQNNTEDLKYLTTIVTLSYSGGKLSPWRMNRGSEILEPGASAKEELPIGIPANYGICNINLSVYSVVDTLDRVMESQKVFSKDFSHSFLMPASLSAALNGDLMVPDYVDKTAVYDNDFGRILTYFLSQGKSVDEIAQITGTDDDFVRSEIDTLVTYGYAKIVADQPMLTFNVINDSRVQRLRPAMDATVDGLVSVIEKNMPLYDSTVKAMVAGGEITGQENNILDPGSILHHKHPVILCLYLWNVLGREFVNNGNVFNIFQLSDPCNAYMSDYMYLVSGSPENTSPGFYYFIPDKNVYQLHCGTSAMPIICGQNYRDDFLKHKRVDWSFVRDSSAIFYTYTDEKVQKPVSMLMDGAIPYVDSLKKAVEKEFSSSDEGRYLRGVKYWCWNLVVDKVMKRIEADGVAAPEGFGFYSLQKALNR